MSQYTADDIENASAQRTAAAVDAYLADDKDYALLVWMHRRLAGAPDLQARVAARIRQARDAATPDAVDQALQDLTDPHDLVGVHPRDFV